jgi:hypothetical protein
MMPHSFCTLQSPPTEGHKKTVGPCSLPQNLVAPLPALEKKGGTVNPDPVVVPLQAGTVELVVSSMLEIDIPLLQGDPGALPPRK